ncbi:MAG: hypothetical protein WKF57_02900, partial [Nakamurella sp.]
PTPQTTPDQLKHDFAGALAAVLTRELRMRARVVGCRTAGYYLPSAYLREFAAVLSAHRVVNVILASAFTALAVSVITLWR